MRYLKLPCTVLAVMILVASTGFAGTMALSKDGSLYELMGAEDGLVLNWTTPDGSTYETAVPQSMGASFSTASVDIDETTATPHVVWQTDGDTQEILLASYVQGTWTGPYVLAGGDGTRAINPQFLVHREIVSYTPDGDDSEPVTVETTFLHVVWWSFAYDGDVGGAQYIGIPVGDDGAPDFSLSSEVVVSDLLPYGIGCHGIEDADQLAFPYLFVEPESGEIKIFATDFANCLFQVVELGSELQDWDVTAKRGRHSIIVGRTSVIAINTALPLGSAKVAMGRGLSVVMYWDAEAAIEYSLLDQNGWTEIRSLALRPDLDHEKAVSLIQSLTR